MSDIDTVRELTLAELDVVGGGTYGKHHFEKDWGKGHHDNHHHHHGKHHQNDANGDAHKHRHHQKKHVCAV